MNNPFHLIYLNILLSVLLILFIGVYWFFKKKPNFLLFLILISFLPLVSIFRSGTYESGDLTLHSVFLESFVQSIKEGIVFPRWSENLCGLKGCPVFMFEYVLPFYIGSVFYFLGFSYLTSTKLMIALTYILSGIGMYLFIKKDFGEKSGFLAALLFLFAPYHLIEMHFRVSVGTLASYAVIPFLFLFTRLFFLQKSFFYFFLSSFSIFLLILAHSSTTLMILPIFIFYFLFTTPQKISTFFFLIGNILLGFTLSSYYLLPALFEVQYTWYSQTVSQPSADYKPFFEYIFSPARYGLLFQGNHGELRLIIGYSHLLVVGLSIFILFKKTTYKYLIILLLFLFLLNFFMLLPLSSFIWNSISLLNTFVLVWRFLLPITFITSLLGALVIKQIKHPSLFIALVIITIFITILNWGNRKMVPEDPHAFEKHWSLYTEYIEPNNPYLITLYNQRIGNAPQIVLEKPTKPIEILNGNATILPLTKTSIKRTYKIHTNSPTEFKVNTFYFPGWHVFANSTPIRINPLNPLALSTITFHLPKGDFTVLIQFLNTPIRTFADSLSSITFLISGGYLIYNSLKRFFLFHNS